MSSTTDKINQLIPDNNKGLVKPVDLRKSFALIDNRIAMFENGTKGILKIADAKPDADAIGIYNLPDFGEYVNLIPIVPIGEDSPSELPITTTDGYYNAVYFDGETFFQIKSTVASLSELKDWNEDSGSFPMTRVFEENIYRVKLGESVTIQDIPGQSEKWEIIGIDGVKVENEEFLKAWVDKDGLLLFGIRNDGSLYSATFDFEKNKVLTEIAYDDENRLEYTRDSEGKLVKSVEADGTNYLPIARIDNLELGGIFLKEKALEDLGKSLKTAGFGGGKGDQTDNTYIQLPIPKTIAFVNFEINPDELPTFKGFDIDTTMQYWDKEGNFYQKDIVLSVQGTSSAGHLRKNFTIDYKDATIRYENWAERDSYYLKSFYTDAFRGQCVMAYRLFKDVINTRPYNQRKAFYSDYQAPNYWNAKGAIQTDMSSGANYVADGFPVAIHCNGEFYGVYTIVQKKHRDNFDMKKGTAKHVWLDGMLAYDFFNGNIIWTDFEVRNPGIDFDINGLPYNGDFPTEIPASPTKNYIIALSNYVNQIDALTTTARKAKFLEYFDLNGIMDYFLFSNLVVNFDGFAKNWQFYTKDGVKWSIALHDLDNIFGQFWKGNIILVDEIPTKIYGLGAKDPTKYMHSHFMDETKLRYKQLRDSGIFSADYITDKLKEWLDGITYPMLKNDLDKWKDTPSFRNSKTNPNWVAYAMDESNLAGVQSWNSATNYAVGAKCKMALLDDVYGFKALTANTNVNPVTGSYETYPPDLGFFNSIDRVRQTIIQRIALMDATYNY
ncbi:CotH kinase family protein [Chryseobacterium sp. FH1]|uniref:CotH kinase family protein n=1 Tax=Chryseobacterium sp. FH1 TaxID=1233951 RepID=UPI0004E3C2BE|nr:CotH kinase family protein [Chryseobacterium sp. FH1]KFC19356.1 hypothetical protein IO90_08605 [Chryseobacterium sp. FH1]